MENYTFGLKFVDNQFTINIEAETAQKAIDGVFELLENFQKESNVKFSEFGIESMNDKTIIIDKNYNPVFFKD